MQLKHRLQLPETLLEFNLLALVFATSLAIAGYSWVSIPLIWGMVAFEWVSFGAKYRSNLEDTNFFLRHFTNNPAHQILFRQVMLGLVLLTSSSTLGQVGVVVFLAYAGLSYLYGDMFRWSEKVIEAVEAVDKPSILRLEGLDGLQSKEELNTGRVRDRLAKGLVLQGLIDVVLVVAFHIPALSVLVTTALMLSLLAVVFVPLAIEFYIFRRLFRVNVDRTADNIERAARQIERYKPEVVVYFSAPNSSYYHLEQWLPVFNRIPHRMLYVLREQYGIEKLKAETKAPILYVRRLAELGRLEFNVPLILYINNGQKNVAMTRLLGPTHAFLHHGESDKIASVNPMAKIYDVLFLAGRVALDRYRDAGIDIEEGGYKLIGRPMTDDIDRAEKRIIDLIQSERGFTEEASAADQDLSNVPLKILYAPTFEGYYEDDNSCSIPMAVRMLKKLNEIAPRTSVVFKPHPLTGTVEKSFASKLQAVTNLVKSMPNGEMIDSSSGKSLQGCFNEAHILIADISSVPVDFLQSEKPCLITDPNNLGESVLYESYPTIRGNYILDKEIDQLAEILRSCVYNDVKLAERVETKKAVLSEYSGNAAARFLQVVDEIVAKDDQPH